jgi:glycosyltransferase involved in cell wall biosynthesis
MRYLYKFADAITTPSTGSAKDLSEFAAIPPNKITVIPNPVDNRMIRKLAAEPVAHEWFRPNQPPVIVGIGELGGSKDYETMIRAFAILRRERQVRLFIMGEGKGRDRLQELIAELHLEADVELFGFTENPFAYLAKSNLFVLSSHYEGFGMALLEALSLGVPSVATDCPFGPSDIMQNGKFGTLIPVGNTKTMATQMALTLDKPPDPSFLMEAVRPYALESITDRYLDLLGLRDHG